MKSYIKRPHADATSWGMVALCHEYNWPTGLVGGGVIGIVELGGGWNQSDIATFCEQEGIPMPSITDVSVDGTKNTPGSDADGEVALDLQVSAAAYSVATGKPAIIRVYWSQDIATAVLAAAKDGCDTISISWGAPESQWSHQDALNMEAAAQMAHPAVVFAAAGDNDAGDGTSAKTVDLPAGCPGVLGCGGTRLVAGFPETVWNDQPGEVSGEGSGGGYSGIFAPQSWQTGVFPGPGRAVPDVSANADPDTGYNIYLDGQWQVVGGTSAVAPLYAGLFAAFGRKLGWVSPKLWDNPKAFNLVESGDNGFYDAGDTPRPPCGLGSPIGTKLAALLVK